MAKYSVHNGYTKTKRRGLGLFAAQFVILAGVGGLIWKNLPAPSTPTTDDHVTSLRTTNLTLPTTLPFPAYGQSAYGVAGNASVAVSDDENKIVPIASLAKIITALAILKQKPLTPGQPGPTFTFTQKDEALFGDYIRKDGAVIPVKAGEQITQHQAMQAMLLPSANNIADSLVIWAFGSLDAYNTYANGMVKELGLSDTSVADASGFSPGTRSSAHDMVELGILYMQNPLLREIAFQPEATIPFAGIVKNYNSLINKNGLVGIKVGHTDEAGRCFMLASVRKAADSEKIEIVSVSVVLGADHLDTAMADAEKIINAGDNGYDEVVKKD